MVPHLVDVECCVLQSREKNSFAICGDMGGAVHSYPTSQSSSSDTALLGCTVAVADIVVNYIIAVQVSQYWIMTGNVQHQRHQVLINKPVVGALHWMIYSSVMDSGRGGCVVIHR